MRFVSYRLHQQLVRGIEPLCPFCQPSCEVFSALGSLRSEVSPSDPCFLVGERGASRQMSALCLSACVVILESRCSENPLKLVEVQEQKDGREPLVVFWEGNKKTINGWKKIKNS